MARPRTSFISAIAHANHLIEDEKVSIEAASEQAADIFNENKDGIIQHIYKQKGAEMRNAVKRRQSKTVGKQDMKKQSQYTYSGPVEFWANGATEELIIRVDTGESEFAKAKEKVKRDLFEKGFNAFIKESNFEDFLKVMTI